MVGAGIGAVVLAAVLGTGCGGAAAVSSPKALPPQLVKQDPLPDRAWGVVESSRFFVAVPLPDLASWRVDDTSGRWLTATHLPSKSMLLVRAWRAGSVVSHAACEEEARRWRPDLFGKDPEALVDRRPVTALPGFDVEVGFAVHKVKDALGGVAVAVGANVRQCLVLAYITRAEGADAPEVLAGRLAFITERVFGHVETRSVEDRVAPLSR
ncbi:MAG TPA: hypothetical protein VF395_18865 [Polyangiaceae bacterium]